MRNRWNTLAFTALVLVFAGMSLYLLLHPDRNGVVPAYRNACAHWWTSQNLYTKGTHGFLYTPSFAVLFTPFHLLRPAVLGEILWRLFGFGLMGWALWKLAGVLNHDHDRRGGTVPAFAGMVLLAVPASLASINNGQTNLPLSAGIVFAALALREEKWACAAFWLTLAVALKPIALAPWLLAFAVMPPVRGPLLFGLSLLAISGLLHPSLTYAWTEWVQFGKKLWDAYTPESLRVSDLFGMLSQAGISPPPALEKGMRGLVCLGALLYAWQGQRRRNLVGGTWAFWVGTSLISTLFNPRAETNSYVLISPLLAFTAVSYFREMEGGKWKGVILSIACLGLMCDGLGKTVYLATDVWLKPLVVLLVSPLLFHMPEEWKVESGRREG